LANWMHFKSFICYGVPSSCLKLWQNFECPPSKRKVKHYPYNQTSQESFTF
jgi:hypothetical protein